MNELTPEEIESIDRVLVALMKGKAYQQWRRDSFAKAALTGFLANAHTSCYAEAQFPEFATIVSQVSVQIADAAVAEADRTAQS